MKTLFGNEEFDVHVEQKQGPVTVLGITFDSDDERRAYFREELRKKLPELKHIEGFPIGEDDDIVNLSDPPYYTACPNPWINDFIAEWEKEKTVLEQQGKRQVDFVVDEPYSKGVKEGKNSAIYNAHTYHTKVPYQAIMRYILHYTQPGDIIYDGFAGTGMTGVAASSCGIPDLEDKNAILIDFSAINKTAKWGYRNAICGDLSPLCFHISSNYNHKINIIELSKTIEEISLYLHKEFDKYYTLKTDTGTGKVNYYVWSEVIGCCNCGEEIIYHNNTSDYANNIFRDFIICSKCGMQQKRTESTRITDSVFDLRTQKVNSQLRYVQAIANVSINKKRVFIQEIPNFDIKDQDGFIPLSEIKIGDKSSDPYRVGCNSVNLFYTDRMQLFLSNLYDKILLYPENRKELMFIFTSMLPKLTKMNRYMPKHGSRALVGPMANTLYIPPMFVENNPIDQFEYQAKKILKAFELCDNNTCVQTTSATSSNIPNDSIDYIFTDPPFGANIMYSELNYITESWLKVWTNNKEEAISNKTQRKGLFEYQEIMERCFIEYYRVLKAGRWMTVEFSNTSASFWNCLQYSIQKAGFVITVVADFNKERGGLHSMLGPTAVKQDLVISCYKPSSDFDSKFQSTQHSNVGVWDFMEEHLNHLPIHMKVGEATTAIIERSPKILYDRLIAFYVQRSLPVPIDAGEFHKGLKERFLERDGMYFNSDQVIEYDEKRKGTTEFYHASLFVSSEQDGVMWLKDQLKDTAQTYQDLQPKWMQAIAGLRKGDILPELRDLLHENFLQNEDGAWYLPDMENEVDLEKVRTNRLLKQFAAYKELASKPKAKIKEVRVEALRVGFKQCYKDKDFLTIVTLAEKIPNNLLMEDEVLLQYYDIASTRVER